VFAPFTYRTTTHHDAVRYSLVLRVRWWPPQRLQRFSRSSKLLRLFQGKNRTVLDMAGRLARINGLWPSRRTPALLFLYSHAVSPTTSAAARLTSVLRC
jgi:hypothetical protein